MRTLLLLATIALLLGPLRRPITKPLLVTHTRFTVPALVGGIAGFLLGAYVAALAGLPPPFPLLVSLMTAAALAVNLGEASKDWFDRTFGKKNGPPTP